MNIRFQGGIQAKISRMGVRGKNGKEVELALVNDWICWRYIGDADWIQLLAIADIIPNFSRDEIIAAIGYEPATDIQGQLAETAVQPATLATALAGKLDKLNGSVDQYYDGTGQLQVMPTAEFNQVPSDWNATTGVAAILNKPILGTAAAANIADFATAAEGALARTAVQPATLSGYALVGHTHSNVTTTTAGFMSAADKVKLNGIAAGATVNSTDAELRDRSTHTGTQPSSSIIGLDANITRIDAELLAANSSIESLRLDVAAAIDEFAVLEPRVATLETNLASANTIIDGLLTTTSTLSSDFASLTTEFEALASNVGTYDTRITAVETLANTNADDIAATNVVVGTHTTRIGELQANVTALDTRVSNTSIAVANNTSDIAALDDDVDALAGRVTANEGSISTINTSITDINANVSAIEANVNTNATEIAALKPLIANNASDIASVNVTVGQHGTRLTNIEAAANTLTSRVNANELAIGELNANVASIDTSIDNLNANVSALTTTLTATNTALDALTVTVGTHTTAIANTNTRVDNLTTAHTATNTALDALTVTVGTHTTAIAAVNTAIANTNTRVDNLQTNVNQLQAQQLQLSSNVGNINAAIAQQNTAIAGVVSEIDTINVTLAATTQTANTAAADIAATNTVVSGHTTAISGLTTRVGTAETDIANLNTVVAGKFDIPTGTQEQRLDGRGIPVDPPVGKPIIIVASGQSNMAILTNDSGANYDYPPNMHVWDFNGAEAHVGSSYYTPANTVSGTAQQFAREVALDNPSSQVYIINVSFGGEQITSWSQNTPRAARTALFNNVAAALAVLNQPADTIVDYFLWWQGESDGDNGERIAAFTAQHNIWLDYLKSQLWYDQHDTKTVYFGLADIPHIAWEGYTGINRQLEDIVASHGGDFVMVRCGDLSAPDHWVDDVHLSGLGYKVIGRRGYRAIEGGAKQFPTIRYGKEDLLTNSFEMTGNGLRFADRPIGWNQNPVLHSNGRIIDHFRQHYDGNATIIGSSSAGTATYTRRGVYYTRIADVVFYTVAIEWSGHTGTGQMRFNSLPLNNYFGMPLPVTVHFRESPAYENPSVVIGTWDTWERTISLWTQNPDGTLTPKAVTPRGQLAMTGAFIRLRETV